MEKENIYLKGSPELTPCCWWGTCCTIFSFLHSLLLIIICTLFFFAFFFLIVLSALQITSTLISTSKFPFSIYKLCFTDEKGSSGICLLTRVLIVTVKVEKGDRSGQCCPVIRPPMNIPSKQMVDSAGCTPQQRQ